MRLYMTILGTAIIAITSIAYSQSLPNPAENANVKGLILLAGYPRQGIEVKIESINSSANFGPATTNADGDYSFANVPAGEYALKFWSVPNGIHHLTTFVEVQKTAITELPTINVASDFTSFVEVGDPGSKIGGFHF